MPYQPVINTVQVDLRFTMGLATAQNSYYFEKGTAWSVGDLDDIIDGVETWWQAGADSLMTNEAALTFMKAVDLTSLDTQIRTKSMNHAGGTLLPAAPANSTFAIKFDTGKRGRGRAGRIFFPFFAEDAIDAFSIPAAALAAMIGYFNDLIAAAPAAVPGASWVVVHRVVDGVRLPVGTTDAVIAAVATDPYLDSMKNRLPFHKRQKRTAP